MTRAVVIPGEGDPCPRCGQPTEIREHPRITDRERRRPFYYRRWFMCVNEACRTTTIVRPEYQVINAPKLVPPLCEEVVSSATNLVTANSTEDVPW
jgi:hypothetical protein